MPVYQQFKHRESGRLVLHQIHYIRRVRRPYELAAVYQAGGNHVAGCDQLANPLDHNKYSAVFGKSLAGLRADDRVQ